jgi:hypothetical protein
MAFGKDLMPSDMVSATMTAKKLVLRQATLMQAIRLGMIWSAVPMEAYLRWCH